MKVTPKKPVVVSEDLTAALSRFNQAFNQISDILLDRANEVEALKLCMVTNTNLMLDGLHGTAKSMLADNAFHRVDGASVYTKQFMKGTQTDEIFGPMLAEDYKRGIWRHNIAGMLPTAHFADLDEVYRASDMALPSMMSILNEHTFMNGTEEVKCPLITAIGTTNYVTESKELDAFHDRWLIRAKIKPLGSASLRVKMLLNSLSQRSTSVIKRTSLDDIALLQRAVWRTEVESETLELYEQIVSKYQKTIGSSLYISDRRLVQSFMLCRAAAVLNSPDGSVPEVEPAHLNAAMYGITTLNDEVQGSAFTDAVTDVVGTFEAYKKESEEMKVISSFVESLEEELSENPKRAVLQEIFNKARKALSGIQNMPSADQPKSVKNQEALRNSQERLSQLVNVASNLLSK